MAAAVMAVEAVAVAVGATAGVVAAEAKSLMFFHVRRSSFP